MSKQRECWLCKKKHDKCNGFVLARDFNEAIKGTMNPDDIRELCNGCALKVTCIIDPNDDWYLEAKTK